jgi:hypothetical protein
MAAAVLKRSQADQPAEATNPGASRGFLFYGKSRMIISQSWLKEDAMTSLRLSMLSALLSPLVADDSEEEVETASEESTDADRE